MANEYYKKLFSIFYKDLVVLFTFSFVYIFFEERNYKVKTNVNDQGHEYDILYDHSSIEISFRRSSKDIENLSEYIESKRRNLNKCSFIFIVDDDRLFEECLKIIEKYKDMEFVIIKIKKEDLLIENVYVSEKFEKLIENIKDRTTELSKDLFFKEKEFLLSPMTCSEITKQYRIMFVFAYFILERFRKFIKNENSFDLIGFIDKEIIRHTNTKNKEILLQKWLYIVGKIAKIFKVSLNDYDEIKSKIKQLETIINELYELSLRKEIKKEDIEKLIEKYSEQIKQK